MYYGEKGNTIKVWYSMTFIQRMFIVYKVKWNIMSIVMSIKSDSRTGNKR